MNGLANLNYHYKVQSNSNQTWAIRTVHDIFGTFISQFLIRKFLTCQKIFFRPSEYSRITHEITKSPQSCDWFLQISAFEKRKFKRSQFLPVWGAFRVCTKRIKIPWIPKRYTILVSATWWNASFVVWKISTFHIELPWLLWIHWMVKAAITLVEAPFYILGRASKSTW
jgi:hypothetical protein